MFRINGLGILAPLSYSNVFSNLGKGVLSYRYFRINSGI